MARTTGGTHRVSGAAPGRRHGAGGAEGGVSDNRKNFSGKHKAHRLLFLALTDEKGNLLWISLERRPGRSSEITTARQDGFAHLKSWRFQTKDRMTTRHATTLLRALLVLAGTRVQR
ncbi:hypothetical protein PV726_46350 [Streptomyces europaeiscabiei]|uniref:hypothetical protein n=1 Tax=Streptomyces europaeiscabiei TaxID=146819 RepID=UPI0029A650A4|nr:hypothetical protein [Streptomyces europaeiscabiei]MDX3697494.1 hypothetical protein [Streptomyces europaeiscabiei]